MVQRFATKTELDAKHDQAAKRESEGRTTLRLSWMTSVAR